MAKKPVMLVVPVERIEKAILSMHGHRVMLDRDLAELYGVPAIALRQQVKRNRERFPEDFMFQLTRDEAETLVSQNVIPSMRSLGGSLPYAFTQEGVAMLSSVLRSRRAVEVYTSRSCARSCICARYWRRTRTWRKLDELEKKYDEHFKVIFETFRRLMAPDGPEPRRFGFASGAKN